MRGRALPYLLIAPAFLFLAVLFMVPLVQTIALAFRNGAGFGFGNFAVMADDLNFHDAVVNTFRLVGIAIPLQIAAALGMAVMLSHLRGGRDLVLWIWSIPLGLSDLAAGLVWLAVLNDQGYLNSLLFHLGLVDSAQSWLTYETPIALFFAVLIAEIWRSTAIVMVILVAGLQVIPIHDGPILSTPLYWNNGIFVAAGNGKLKFFPLAAGAVAQTPLAAQSPESLGATGATSVLSSNGASNAILWLIDPSGTQATPNTPAILRAYDANNLSNEIYNSAMVAPRDSAGLAINFTVPTVANGKVYLGTQGELDVYGLLQ